MTKLISFGGLERWLKVRLLDCITTFKKASGLDFGLVLCAALWPARPHFVSVGLECVIGSSPGKLLSMLRSDKSRSYIYIYILQQLERRASSA